MPLPGSSADVPADPGVAALVVVARFHGIAADASQLRHAAGMKSERFNERELLLAARSLGLKVRSVRVQQDRLTRTPFPAIALDNDGRHFIIAACDKTRALVLDAGASVPVTCAPEEVIARSGGCMLLFASRASLAGELARFDFSWFIPAVVKYRRLLLEVLLVSAVLQIFGLVSPLMFQVVMDKVLVNRAFSTLNVVCAALLVSAIFEVVLTGVRNYVFSHTTNRIDVELGARLFRHLLALPLAYFSARRVGDTVARVRELENIRNFLTGQALTAVLDLFFSIIFLAVMCFYSVKLTLIVVISLPLYASISAVLNPILRTRLNEKFARGADNQSFLVEAVSGMETVKSMAVEPQFTRRWDNQLTAYVASGFRVSTLGNVGQQMIQLVGKLVTVTTLFFGAKFVIDGRLSVGQLIAFNMMSQRVASPVLRLAQIWQDFQQIGISMGRLGDILNARTELPASRQALPAVSGQISFQNVRFRYTPDGPSILNDISLDIRAGEMVGIVGRSGSGKSTLTKLLQRLYLPVQGRVLIDGVDLALADPAWLRRQIGVVLQENLLFNRSIRENIALSDVGLPLEAVIGAARLAGAHDFIAEMPEGYDTLVGEHGSNLSGGQRQRIAIARALVTNPRILIFDEATSALDFETERIIQTNMRAMCNGRTVIVIAHRLTAVRQADHIVAMDKGQIVERGSHDELLRSGGYYARLIELQNAWSDHPMQPGKFLWLSAFGDLLRRYLTVFGAAWSIRKQLDSPSRLAHELAFLPANLELAETPVHPAPRWTMRIIVSLAAVILLIVLVGKLDIVAVAKGKLLPDARVKVVQPAITGVVHRILVRDGQHVKAGELLMELDTTQAAADSNKAHSAAISAALTAARVRALLAARTGGGAPAMAAVTGASAQEQREAQSFADGQYREYQDKVASAQAELTKREAELETTRNEVEKLKSTAPLARQQANDYAGLVGDKYVARQDYLAKEQTARELEHELAAQQSHAHELTAGIAEQKAEVETATSAFRRELLDTLDKATQQLSQSQDDETKARTRQQLLSLFAPVAGTVQQLAVHTVGGVVTTAQALMEIVPDDGLEVEVNIENKDIGFVEVGQDAIVKIEAFPYTRFGYLTGKVVSVSNDAVQDKKLGLTFVSRIRLPADGIPINGKWVHLTPGMEVTAEIKTGKRSVAHYFLDPLVQTSQESMRER